MFAIFPHGQDRRGWGKMVPRGGRLTKHYFLMRTFFRSLPPQEHAPRGPFLAEKSRPAMEFMPKPCAYKELRAAVILL